MTLHGGRLHVESAGVNHGSEFIVSLPLVGDTTTATGEESGREEPPGTDGARRILVVDDNVDAAESLAALLRLRDHDVRVAHDGRAALDTVTAFRPQIVFLDIAMPDMDGYEVARQLRQGLALDDFHLVAVTGFGRDEDRRLAKEAGFDRHVTKPLDPAALPALLAGLGDRR